jgi:hypothetical protein
MILGESYHFVYLRMKNWTWIATPDSELNNTHCAIFHCDYLSVLIFIHVFAAWVFLFLLCFYSNSLNLKIKVGKGNYLGKVDIYWNSI